MRVRVRRCAPTFLAVVVLLFVYEHSTTTTGPSSPRAPPRTYFRIEPDYGRRRYDDVPDAALNMTLLARAKNATHRHAFVFYASNEAYMCHVMIAVARLLLHLDTAVAIDVVVLVLADELDDDYTLLLPDMHPIVNHPASQGRLHIVPSPPMPSLTNYLLAHNDYYLECYGKLRVFELHAVYERVVYMDADGWPNRNLDHLFHMDMRGHEIATVPAIYNKSPAQPWVTSAFFVAILSPSLAARISHLLTPSSLEMVATALTSEGIELEGVFDMELVNYATARGRSSHRLPYAYCKLDTHFVRLHEHERQFDDTFYIHFSHRKPFHFASYTKAISHNRYVVFTMTYTRLMRAFWRAQRRQCPKLPMPVNTFFFPF